MSVAVIELRKRLRPKVYSAAIYIVGVFILLQLIALASIFWFRGVVMDKASSASAVIFEGELIDPEKDPLELPLPPVLPRLSMPLPQSQEAQILQLNEQARQFRLQNDFVLAEALLKRASQLNPDYPNTLVNFAMLEEARGRQADALAYWQRVIALGERASTTLKLAQDRAALLTENLRREKEARAREQVILQSPQKLVLKDTTITPSPLPAKPSSVQIDFQIHSKYEFLDPGKMKVQVFLYEKLPNGDLLPADIHANFLNTHPDWSGNGTETLRVSYQRAGQRSKNKDRTFYGYLIRIIYEGDVEIEQAEPAALIKLFPH